MNERYAILYQTDENYNATFVIKSHFLRSVELLARFFILKEGIALKDS